MDLDHIKIYLINRSSATPHSHIALDFHTKCDCCAKVSFDSGIRIRIPDEVYSIEEVVKLLDDMKQKLLSWKSRERRGNASEG